MHLVGATQHAMPVAPPERETRIFRQRHPKTQRRGMPHRRLHRIVGDHAGHHQIQMPSRAQQALQLRACKRAACVFGDRNFPAPRLEAGLEGVARLARTIGGLGLYRIALDVIDRTFGVAPGRQCRGLGFRMITRTVASPGRVVDRLLHVDEE